MRIIDADMIPNYKLDGLAKAGEMEVPCKFRIVHWKDIEAMPTIDPESLQVVKQLRAEVERLNKGIENLSKNVENAYKQRDELRAELEKVKAERDAAIRDIEEAIKLYREDEGWTLLCKFCAVTNSDCRNECCPKWRGVKED